MKIVQRHEGYWHVVGRQFRRNRVAMAGLVTILAMFAVAAAGDFIAGDRPLVMRYQGRIYFPVLKAYAVGLGVSRWPPEFQNITFKDFEKSSFKSADWAQFPPIPYSPNEVNLNEPLRRPSLRHFFGTDDIGRDVASRIVHGSRVSLSVNGSSRISMT